MRIIKLVIFLICVFSNYLTAQNFSTKYNFYVKNDYTNTELVFPAEFFYNTKDKVKLYKVKLGIENKEMESDNVFVSNKKSENIIYSDYTGKVYLLEYIPSSKEENYFFFDDYEMKWKLTEETKLKYDVRLRKASTVFRGREYICWFAESVKITEAPWKFKNLPGLAYEIYDTQNKFRWELVSYTENSNLIENPFKDFKYSPISYKEYPNLRYGLSPELKKKLSQNPNNRMLEQERDGLEIIFEWE